MTFKGPWFCICNMLAKPNLLHKWFSVHWWKHHSLAILWRLSRQFSHGWVNLDCCLNVGIGFFTIEGLAESWVSPCCLTALTRLRHIADCRPGIQGHVDTLTLEKWNSLRQLSVKFTSQSRNQTTNEFNQSHILSPQLISSINQQIIHQPINQPTTDQSINIKLLLSVKIKYSDHPVSNDIQSHKCSSVMSLGRLTGSLSARAEPIAILFGGPGFSVSHWLDGYCQ